jgi:hypothetical protein
MGRPQLGFPRPRFAAGRATGIAIGLDHTPPWVAVRQNRTVTHGLRERDVIFSGGMAVSVEMP